MADAPSPQATPTVSIRSLVLGVIIVTTVVVAASFVALGIDGVYRGDAQSFRLIAEEPFGDGSRLAADPDVGDQGTAYRFGRPLYPLAAWLLAFGQAKLVVFTLPSVSVLAIATVAGLVARLCGQAGVPPERALAVLAVPTLGASAALGYAEPLAIALLLSVFVAHSEQRWRMALIAAALLVLTREAYAVALLPLLWEPLRRREYQRVLIAASAALLPYGAWLVWIRIRVGGWSFRDPSSSRTDALGPPVSSYLTAVHDAKGVTTVIAGASILALVVVIGLALAALVWRHHRRQDRTFALGLVATALLGLAVGPQGYRFPGDGLRVVLSTHVLFALMIARDPELLPRMMHRHPSLERREVT